MLMFVEVSFTVPMNSACGERGFSEHGIVKNKLRNRLRIVTLDALMRCTSLLEDYKTFDYAAAVKLFHDRPQAFRMPGVFKAVNALEYDGNTDSGDSADLDDNSDLEGVLPAMYFDSSQDEEDSVVSEDEAAAGYINSLSFLCSKIQLAASPRIPGTFL